MPNLNHKSLINNTVYAALISRRHALDTAKWQVPSMAFTGQAFLFLIAFGKDNGFYGAIAGLLNLGIGFATFQLMVRHNYFEVQTSRNIEDLEKRMRFHAIGLKIYHESPAEKTDGCFLVDFITNLKSRNIWLGYFFISSLAGLIPVVAYVGPPIFRWLCEVTPGGG